MTPLSPSGNSPSLPTEIKTDNEFRIRNKNKKEVRYLRVITVWERDFVLPFLGWTKPRNFENISDEERAEIIKRFQEIEQALGEKQDADLVMQKYREMSEVMMMSSDLCLRAFGSQIGLFVLFYEKTKKR